MESSKNIEKKYTKKELFKLSKKEQTDILHKMLGVDFDKLKKEEGRVDLILKHQKQDTEKDVSDISKEIIDEKILTIRINKILDQAEALLGNFVGESVDDENTQFSNKVCLRDWKALRQKYVF